MAYSFQVVKIILIILLAWVAQTLFLHEVLNNGIHGDDLNALFWFHAFRGDLPSQFPFLWNDKTIFILQQIYYMGLLQGIFGFMNFPPVQLTHLFFKTLAGLSLSLLIYKLVKDKTFAVLTVFFFLVSLSTTGTFIALAQGTAYLAMASTAIFALFYYQSFKQPSKILPASLFFFLALIISPPRTFPIIVIPFIVELIRLKNKFRPFVFLGRLFIFYFLPYKLLSKDSGHVTGRSWFVHLQDFTSGNYYSISYPFQVISSLFIDKSFLKYIFFPRSTLDLYAILIQQLLLLPLSILLGLIVKFKKPFNFLIKITLSTLLLRILFFVFGTYSHDLPFDGGIIQQVNFNKISFSQASFGGYFVIFGILLVFEWWKNQRNDKVMMVLSGAWFWILVSLMIVWFSAGGVDMIGSDRRYVLPISLGSTIFSAGIFTLLIKKMVLKVSSFFLLGIIIFMITFVNYNFLNNYFWERNQQDGSDSGWQREMFQRFLEKFGQANLYKDALIYLDYSKSNDQDREFYKNSVGNFYILVFFDKGYLTRDNCKAVIYDKQVLKKTYKIINGRKGFLVDYPPTLCVKPVIGYDGKTTFYPMDNFYAYSLQNREFIDIKESILNEFSGN